ncbi:MAG: polysaccharide biosynthesis/export family protein [Endozoicomonas sp.]
MKTKFNTFYALLCTALFWFLAGCSSQHSKDKDNTPYDFTETIDHTKGLPGEQLVTLDITSEAPVFKTYSIAPGDVLDVVYHLERKLITDYPITLYHALDIKFVNVPSLNQNQEILPDGTVSLPYLGSYSVVGKTTSELSEELKEAYKDYLRNPEVYITIRNFNTRVEQLRIDLRTAGRGLSKLIKVRPDGYATFPLLGEYYVASRTIQDVFEEIDTDYIDYMPGLKVDLFMHEQSGTNIYVLGELKNPGAYEVNRPISVPQAVARAGGYTREAETTAVIVFRRDGQKVHAHRFDMRDMSTYGAQALNFYLQPEDVLLIPRNKVSSAAQLMREIADIAFFRGFGISGSIDLINNNSNN